MENCSQCHLSNSRFLQIQTVGNCSEEECELLILGDAPKAEDDTSGAPFTGTQYNFIWELLNSIGVKFRVSYLLRCVAVDSRTRRYRKPYVEEYRNCMEQNLLPEINRINPECILIFGQSTLEVFLGNETVKVADFRERVSKWSGYKFLATYHPTFVLNSDKDIVYDRLIDDIVYACRHAMKHRSEGLYKTITLTPDQFVRVSRIWCDDPSIEYVGYDTESNGLDPLLEGAKITSFSVAVDKDPCVGYNIFMYHPELSDITDLDRSRVIEAAKELLTKKKVVSHNAKHEHRFCKVCWKFTPNIVDDTMFMSYILYLSYPGMRHGLKFLSGRFLALPPWEEYIDSYSELFKKLKRRKYLKEDIITSLVEEYAGIEVTPEDINRFWSILKDPDYYIKQEESEDSDVYYWLVPSRILEKYAGMDAIAPLLLKNVMKPMIESDKGLLSAYTMMMKGANAFANMELKGMRIDDIDRWTTIYEDRLAQRLEELREFPEVKELELDKISEFNPNSSVQCADLFFERFRFPVKELTGKGSPSTSETTIIDLIKEYRDIPGSEEKLRFLETFREYKKLKKLLTAYLIGLRRFIKVNNAFDGNTCEYLPVPEGDEDMHIHPQYKLHTVDTGRVASADPSLHTVPAGSDIKRLFVSHWKGRGGIIVTADQSQLELRVLASIIERYYGDSSLAQAYREGRDIHRFNASKVFAKPMEEIVDTERRFAKTISFSLLYGASEASVAESTGRTKDEVHNLFETFYSSFPGIKKYIEASHEYARQYGCVRTPMGRIKYALAAQHPEDRMKYSTSLRQVQNGIIQSSGSDMSFQSIVYMDEYFRGHGLSTKVVGFIHDSIELDACPGEWFLAYDILKYSMKDMNEAMDWVTCPLGIDAEFGTSLGDTVGVVSVEILEDRSRIFTLKGYDYILNDIVEEAKYGYDILLDEILSEEEFFNKPGDLIARRALNLSFDNKTFNLQTRKCHLKPKVGSYDSLYVFNKDET